MAPEARSTRFIRIALFASLYAALQFGWSSARDTWLERILIDELTVRPAAWLVRHITPEVMAQAVGTHIKAVGGGINILNGCEGFDVVFLLAAAMLVAPLLQMRWRWLGMGCGCIVIWLCNQGRILAMFYANRSDKVLFEVLHGMVAPVVLILIATGFFMFWVARFADRSDPQLT